MPAMSKEEELALLLLLLNHLLVVKSAGEENDGMLRAPLWVDKPTTTTNNSSSSLPFSLPFTFCASLSLSLLCVCVCESSRSVSVSFSSFFHLLPQHSAFFSIISFLCRDFGATHISYTPGLSPLNWAPLKKPGTHVIYSQHTTKHFPYFFGKFGATMTSRDKWNNVPVSCTFLSEV